MYNGLWRFIFIRPQLEIGEMCIGSPYLPENQLVIAFLVYLSVIHRTYTKFRLS